MTHPPLDGRSSRNVDDPTPPSVGCVTLGLGGCRDQAACGDCDRCALRRARCTGGVLMTGTRPAGACSGVVRGDETRRGVDDREAGVRPVETAARGRRRRTRRPGRPGPPGCRSRTRPARPRGRRRRRSASRSRAGTSPGPSSRSPVIQAICPSRSGLHAETSRSSPSGGLEHRQRAVSLAPLRVAVHQQRLRVDQLVPGARRRGWPRSSPAPASASRSCSWASSSRGGSVRSMIALSWVRSRPMSRTRSVFSSRCSARFASGERPGEVTGLGADDAGVPVRRGAGHRRARAARTPRWPGRTARRPPRCGRPRTGRRPA